MVVRGAFPRSALYIWLDTLRVGPDDPRSSALSTQQQGAMPMRSNGTIRASALAVIGTLSVGAGCPQMSKMQRGAVIGAAGGAAVGAAVGKATGSTARGAIIGAAVGGAAGAIIGRQMDKQAEQLAMSIPGATVQRVGEGIVVT